MAKQNRAPVKMDLFKIWSTLQCLWQPHVQPGEFHKEGSSLRHTKVASCATLGGCPISRKPRCSDSLVWRWFRRKNHFFLGETLHCSYRKPLNSLKNFLLFFDQWNVSSTNASINLHRSTFRSSENTSKTLRQEIGYSTTRYGESFQPRICLLLLETLHWQSRSDVSASWTKISPTKQLNALAAIREDQAKEQLGKFGCEKPRNNSYQNGTTTATTFPFRVTFSNLIQLKTISNFFQATEECVPAPSCATWPHSLRLEDKALVWNQVFSMGVMDFSYPKQTSRLSRINKKHIFAYTFATCKTYAPRDYSAFWRNTTRFLKQWNPSLSMKKYGMYEQKAQNSWRHCEKGSIYLYRKN